MMHEFDSYDKMVSGWIDKAFARNEPRQARVSRVDREGVWVRFPGQVVDALVPSTIANPPVGSEGWVYPVGGGKGLFVVTEVPTTIIDRLRVATSYTGSTSGTHWLPGADLVIPGLMPSHEYTAKCDIEVRTTGTTVRTFSVIARAVGATTAQTDGPNVEPSTLTNQVTKATNIVRVRPDASGVITFTPGFAWAQGTVTVNAVALTVTLV